eukprot:11356-Heterococcus_DN1.PRE.2
MIGSVATDAMDSFLLCKIYIFFKRICTYIAAKARRHTLVSVSCESSLVQGTAIFKLGSLLNSMPVKQWCKSDG